MTSKTYTVTEAAQMFDRSGARIRQICIEHNLGTVIANGLVRLLTTDDLKKIKAFFATKRKYTKHA